MSEQKNSDFSSIEISANRFNLKIQCVALAVLVTTTVLNMLDIFIVNDALMYTSLVMSVICTLASILVFMKCDHSAKWVKYFILTSLVIMITICGIALTYHMVMMSVLPVLCSSQYKQKRIIFYTFALSVISTFVVVMCGFYFGLCDANMLVLTTGLTAEYYDPETGMTTFGAANLDPWTTLPLYYALPRVFILFVMMHLIIHISNVISESAIKEATLKKLSETDTMTQLYNKNKYSQMIKEYYPNVKNVGVIFWDVNDLKQVNDTMGHEFGDYLISTVAMSINKFTSEKNLAYRIGGDEFVMIAENADESELLEIIESCRNDLETKNKASNVKLFAAVGYSLGSGKDIEAVVKDADMKMYANKHASKSVKAAD